MSDEKRHHKLTMRSDSISPVDPSILIRLDDLDLRGVTRVEFKAAAGELLRATIEMYVRPDFQLPAEVEVRAAECDCATVEADG